MKPLFKFGLAIGLISLSSAAHTQPPVPKVDVPGVFQNVQSDESYRINELEETVRRLNGKVEELNFLLLQLQEKVRRMEEENEGRFQELEDKRSDLKTDTPEVAEKVEEKTDRLGKPKPSDEIPSSDVKIEAEDKQPAAPPRALGTLTFDKDGNVIDSDSENALKLSGLPGIFNDGVEGGVEAAEFGATPKEVLDVGRAAIKDRQFKRAQQAMSAFLKAWPNDPDVGVAKFHLGKAYFWQKDYYRAADSHLDAHNNFPEAETAADNLLALGLALAGLNQREVACATYAEVLNQYPDAQPRLGERVKDEQAAARC